MHADCVQCCVMSHFTHQHAMAVSPVLASTQLYTAVHCMYCIPSAKLHPHQYAGGPEPIIPVQSWSLRLAPTHLWHMSGSPLWVSTVANVKSDCSDTPVPVLLSCRWAFPMVWAPTGLQRRRATMVSALAHLYTIMHTPHVYTCILYTCMYTQSSSHPTPSCCVILLSTHPSPSQSPTLSFVYIVDTRGA
jgi:hypothetical protein